MKCVLDVDKVSKSFKEKNVLNEVSLKFYEGEKFVLLGENGAGKSTLFYHIFGIYNKDKGKIIKEKDKTLSGFVEEPVLMKHMNAYQNLKYIAQIYNKKISKEEMDKYLEIVGMKKHAKKKAGKYSTGMRKRVAVASLLMIDPDIYIFDEPTEGLDPKERDNFMNILEELKQKGKCVIVSTHVLSEAKKYADRVGIMHKGKIQQILHKEDFYKENEYILKVNNELPEWVKHTKTKDNECVLNTKNIGELIKKLVDEGIEIINIRNNEDVLKQSFMSVINEA